MSLSFPENTFAVIHGRSGLALKGIFCHSGVLDQDYSGEIKVILFNLTDVEYHVKISDRIAQLVFHSSLNTKMVSGCAETKMEKDEAQIKMERGVCGFGSSGV